MKKMVLLPLSLLLLLISCQNKSIIINNNTQTEYELVGYTPDSFEVYRLYFYDKFGASKGHMFYVKIDTQNISKKRNTK